MWSIMIYSWFFSISMNVVKCCHTSSCVVFPDYFKARFQIMKMSHNLGQTTKGGSTSKYKMIASVQQLKMYCCCWWYMYQMKDYCNCSGFKSNYRQYLLVYNISKIDVPNYSPRVNPLCQPNVSSFDFGKWVPV